GFGPGMGLAPRYIILAAPLLCALYIPWLAYGPDSARRAVHVGLLAIVCLAARANIAFGLRHGGAIRAVERDVEWGLKTRVPSSELMRRVCPAIFDNPDVAYERFKMLRIARTGAFESFNDDRMAAAPDPPASVRR